MTDAGNPTKLTRIAPVIQGVLLGLAAIAVGMAARWFLAQDTPPTTIELKRMVDTLPNSSMKSYALRLPRAGRLAIKVSSPENFGFNAYLVRVEAEQPPGKSNTRRFVEAFTAEQVRSYDRSGRISRGDYHLTLVNSAALTNGAAPEISLYASLDP